MEVTIGPTQCSFCIRGYAHDPTCGIKDIVPMCCRVIDRLREIILPVRPLRFRRGVDRAASRTCSHWLLRQQAGILQKVTLENKSDFIFSIVLEQCVQLARPLGFIGALGKHANLGG